MLKIKNIRYFMRHLANFGHKFRQIVYCAPPQHRLAFLSFFLRHYICVMLQLRMGPAIVLLVIKVAVNTRDSGNGIAGTMHNVSKWMKLF